MRFKVPPNCSAVTHGGATHTVSAEGAIEADGAAAPLLLAHGILPWPEADEAAAPSAPTTRETLVAALAAAGVAGPYPKTLAALRRALRAATRGEQTQAKDAPPARR
jgi:hypothetical protein